VDSVGCRLLCPALLGIEIGDGEEKITAHLGAPEVDYNYTVNDVRIRLAGYKSWNVWYDLTDGRIYTMGIAADPAAYLDRRKAVPVTVYK